MTLEELKAEARYFASMRKNIWAIAKRHTNTDVLGNWTAAMNGIEREIHLKIAAVVLK